MTVGIYRLRRKRSRRQLPVTGSWVKPSNKINSQAMTVPRCCWKAGLLVENSNIKGTMTNNNSYLYHPLQFRGWCHTHHRACLAPALWEVGTFRRACFLNEALQLWDIKWFIQTHRDSRCHRQNLNVGLSLSLKCQLLLQTALIRSPTLAHPQPLRWNGLYII